MQINATPRKYQKKGVKKIVKKFKGKALLADDMGLGKSLQSIMTIAKLNTKTIICCPAPLKYNWVSELAKFCPGVQPYVCSGRKTPNTKVKADILICNYEIVQYWKKYLIGLGVNFIICDESHFVKSRKALRTKAVISIANKCRYKLLLSGTPIENKPAELFTQLQIIDKTMFPSWTLFIKRYNGAYMDRFGWKLATATNTNELHNKLKELCMVRRRKQDVLKELPEKVRQVIPVEISNRAEYDAAKKDIIAWIRRNTKLNVKKVKKAKQMAELDKLKYLSAKGKINQCVDWINERSQAQKLVVFCYHVDVINEVYKKLNNCVLVDSSKSSLERQHLVDKFQEDDSVRVFLTTVKVGGTGLTLTASSTTVFLQQDWNASKHNQAEDRVHRIGQTADMCHAIYFVAKDTIEEKIINLIDAKRKDASAIIDGEKVDDSELLTELLDEMAKED